jgi:uncharacterized protein (TIGR03790 family)
MKTIVTAFLFLGAALAVRAAGAGDEVVLVYNSRMPESRQVALHYAKCRQVPPDHVFSFALPTTEDISRKEFQDSLQKPLAKALEDKKLWRIGTQKIVLTIGADPEILPAVTQTKIRYLVLCYGVPVHIFEDTALKELPTEKLRPELRRNEAAVDSELALLPRMHQGLALGGPLSNPLYTVTNKAWMNPTNGLLMVARLDGPNAEVASGLVDKAMEAETNGLWGRAYFDLRGTTSPGYKLGDEWIRTAGEICRRFGFDSVVDSNAATFPAEFPMSQIAFYCGWYDEHASGPFTRKNVEFMPGAFAYHLHSFSACPLRSTTNRWAGPLVFKGATCTMGCVAEPFLSGTPDVGTFMARFVFLGFSFGEAAYASQSVLSWQTTVVGDPLYRPFNRPPQEVHEELERAKSKNLEWSYERLMNLNQVMGKPVPAVAEFLQQLPLTKESAVLTEKLADYYVDEGKPSSALEMYEKALDRHPSPQQRVRLRLAIADRLEVLDHKRDLYNDLRQLNDENPDYPAKFEVLKKVLNLAIAMGDKEAITNSTYYMQREMQKFTEAQAEQEKRK